MCMDAAIVCFCQHCRMGGLDRGDYDTSDNNPASPRTSFSSFKAEKNICIHLFLSSLFYSLILNFFKPFESFVSTKLHKIQKQTHLQVFR